MKVADTGGTRWTGGRLYLHRHSSHTRRTVGPLTNASHASLSPEPSVWVARAESVARIQTITSTGVITRGAWGEVTWVGRIMGRHGEGCRRPGEAVPCVGAVEWDSRCGHKSWRGSE